MSVGGQAVVVIKKDPQSKVMCNQMHLLRTATGLREALLRRTNSLWRLRFIMLLGPLALIAMVLLNDIV